MPARVTCLVESTFRLDGGAMFGVVPKTLWSRTFPADEHNRIELAARVLVVEGDGYLALVDAGMGDAWSAKERDIYGLSSGCGIEDGLGRLGHRVGDVTDVILTHLHFDHAGGIVRADGSLRFPRATHHVQKANVTYAAVPAPKDAGSYLPRTLEALGRSRLRLLDGPGEILPAMHASLSVGHTEALQIVTVETARGPVVFPADLVPTRAHVHLPWIMAYDNQPLRMMDEKSALYAELLARGGLLVLEHDPEVEAVRVEQEEGRWVGRATGIG